MRLLSLFSYASAFSMSPARRSGRTAPRASGPSTSRADNLPAILSPHSPASALCASPPAPDGPFRQRRVEQQPLSLQDYSTFQYMLAPPALARPVCDRISSLVFYDGPHEVRKSEREHKVTLRGRISVPRYYLCCLWVLPSHVLGLSRWVSATEARDGGATVRRFRYAYYGGLVEVDTRHVADGAEGTFRLVEYIDGSAWASVIGAGFYAAVLAAVGGLGGVFTLRTTPLLLVVFVLFLKFFAAAASRAMKSNF
eukprot:CAMPEP_0194339964 /NCGR_PEP_ID=MMETSP0171-20130528/84910_1 /TAXON_ID=218684 /ORGANISM="Corethron pennatum, Strain L29A3" /LENGTH=253 /DNA_ID=CAMNT_0039104743 /DNA_START=94 /DNA_END=858 /DNA_ORIENTATION=+